MFPVPQKKIDCEGTSEILELASATELLQLIECPVCKEVPFPPIFNCKKGHILCNACRSKLVACPLCTKSFSDARNYAVESIVLRSKHACKFKDFGCELVISGELMTEHVQKCPFRGHSSICHLGKYTKCAYHSQPMPLIKYLEHLKKVHLMLPSISTPPNVIFESHALENQTDTFWLGDYLTYDSQTFIVRQFMRNSTIYLSLALIGDETKAKQYLVKIRISSKIDKACNIQWTLPVHSISESEDFVKDRLCGVVPFEFVKTHFRSGPGFSAVSVSALKLAKNTKKPCVHSRKITFCVEYKLSIRNMPEKGSIRHLK